MAAVGDAFEHVLLIVGGPHAINLDAYVLTGAIDAITVCGERLAEARHRDHGLRILMTIDALFGDWQRDVNVQAAA
jgi:hypothetical protein